MSGSDSEEDFMSDAFLAKLTEAAPKASTSSSTYAEKRRRATATSEARAKANQLKPFRQREEEARQEGLRTNLIEKELEAGKEGGEMGVGMRMMLKLGYAPDENSTSVKSHETVGGSLGEVAPSSEDLEDAGDAEGARGGLGSSKRRKLDVPPLSTPVPEVSTSKPASGLLEPLSISIWAGRKGVGAKTKTSTKAAPPPPTTIQPLDTSMYRSRGSAEYAERKAEGQLGSARKTVLDLDGRDDKGFSILHLSPTDITTFPPPLLQALCLLPPAIQSFSAAGNQSQAELLKAQMAADYLAPLEGGGLEEDDEVGGQMGFGGLQKEREKEGFRQEGKVPLPENEDDGETSGEDWDLLAVEAQKLLVLPASQRLPLTLQYLRSEYNYCFFCGCSYDGQEDLERNCPGESEDDHD